MPPTHDNDIEAAITAAPQVGPNMKHTDVWPGYGTSVDPSRVDRVQAALRTKIETMNSFDDSHRAVKKMFADADVDKSGNLDESEFVKIMINKLNFQGYEVDVRALFRRFDIDRVGKIGMDEFSSMLFNEPGTRATTAIGKVREILTKRSGGVSSLKGLGLQYRLMDSDNTGAVNRAELELGFEKFMRGFGVKLTKVEIDELFKLFDKNHDNNISYEEFIYGIRGSMNDERKQMVRLAWAVIDESGKGYITLQDVARKYDVSGHPLVKEGKMTPAEAVKAFMSHWHLDDKKHTDDVTEDDFVNYYEWVSSVIDRDDYFELMIRNAWHIDGGSGWSENTSNLRVLVTHEDGHQSVEAVKVSYLVFCYMMLTVP